MTNELTALLDVQSAGAAIAGFAVVTDAARSARELSVERPAGELLAAFRGPYGADLVGGTVDGLHWAGVRPGSNEVLTTWSQHEDEAGICVVEGEFYAEAWRHRPVVGDDGMLAKDLLSHFGKSGYQAVNELSGIFSGFIFVKKARELWLFVDQTGTRTLYYRVAAGRCEAASCIYGLRAGTGKMELDPRAVTEAIVFKAPLEDYTLFRGVRVVCAGRAVELTGNRAVKHRYFRFPQRLPRMSDSEIGESIVAALIAQVRYLGLDNSEMALGLSAGKDCRVICSALVAAGARPHALTVEDDLEEGPLARRVAEACGLPTDLIGFDHVRDTDEQVGASCDAAILSEGTTPGYKFQVLAACARRRGRALFTGWVGDHLSGSWSGLAAWRIRSVDQLSRANFALRGFAFDPKQVAEWLTPELRVPVESLHEHWRQAYHEESAGCDDVLSAHVSMQLGYRNSRGFGGLFNAMRGAVTPVQLFAGRQVLEAYLRLPVAALKGQKAHILAAIHGVPELGDIPSAKAGGRVPLKWEYSLWPLLHAAQEARRLIARFKPAGARGRPGSPPRIDQRTRRFYQAIGAADPFDQKAIRTLLNPELGPEVYPAVHRLAALWMHAELGLKGTCSLPPLWYGERRATAAQ